MIAPATGRPILRALLRLEFAGIEKDDITEFKESNRGNTWFRLFTASLFAHAKRKSERSTRGGGGVGSFVCERSEQEEQREYNSPKCFYRL